MKWPDEWPQNVKEAVCEYEKYLTTREKKKEILNVLEGQGKEADE